MKKQELFRRGLALLLAVSLSASALPFGAGAEEILEIPEAVELTEPTEAQLMPIAEPAPTQPVTVSTEPVETQPVTESTEPAETQPATESTEPAETQPAAESTEPAETQPATESTEPAETQPVTEPTEPAPTQPVTEPTEPEEVVEEVTEPTEEVVFEAVEGEAADAAVELSCYEQLMAAETLAEFHDAMMADPQAMYALTVEELTALQTRAETLYRSLEAPTADEAEYYDLISDTLEVLLEELDEITKTLEEAPVLEHLLSAQTPKELYDIIISRKEEAASLSESELKSVQDHAEAIYAAIASPSSVDKQYKEQLTVAFAHFASEGKIPLDAVPLTLERSKKALESKYYFLTEDLVFTTTSNSGYVSIPAGVTVTLDLNGYALIGNKEKSVIYNHDGDLTIEDSRPNSGPRYYRKWYSRSCKY